jgi:hypothetical protein
MKTCLIALLFIAAAATSMAAETYTAPARPRTAPRERPTPLRPGEVDGVIPRGIRGGNFWQMFNPKAPAKYGTSQEAISYDPAPMNRNTRHDEAGKWRGIKLFVFRF